MKWLTIPQIALLSILLLAAACTSTPDYPATDAAQSPDSTADAEPAEDDPAEDGGGEPDAQPDVGPCEGACSGESPHCETESGACVACLDDTHCTDGVCADDNTCVTCLGDDDCDTGVCDTDANACVECVDDAQCGGTTPACDVEDNECVQCVANENCNDPTASACSDQNSCIGCAGDDECAHLDDTLLCDADAGTCVECTVDDESACGGNSCDPATNTCTDTPVGTLGTCKACKADSECEPNHRCVPMEFDGQALEDGFCLKTVSSGCERPYGGTVISEESLSGATSDDYCGIVESLTSCQAVRDLQSDPPQSECSTDEDCGLDGQADGRCETVGAFADHCTYSCSASLQCPDGFVCASGTTNSNYCGGL